MGKSNPSDYHRAKALFIEALSLSRLERRAFLDEHCRDDSELRNEVESLLRYDDESRRAGFLEESLGILTGKRSSPPNNDGSAKPRADNEETTSYHAQDESGISRRPTLGRFGNYDLLQEVAQGGMGIVYKARQHQPERIVAVKLLRAGELASRKAVQRFQAEAQAAASLRHPNIVSIHEVGEIDGRHYFSMDYVDGQSLADLIQNDAMSETASAQCVRTIAEAIQFAHSQGILHRDVKPSNVLIDVAGHVHVTDFGLAKQIDQDSELTESGEIVGTPSYMSPEQALGDFKRVAPTTDVYSLGALLYTLLTGRPPFRAETPIATMIEVTESEPVAPRLLNPKLSSDLETICLRCLEKSPANRYQSAQELADDLGNFLEGNPIKARKVSSIERVFRWSHRNRVAFSLAIGLCLVVVIGLVAILSLNSLLRQRSQEALGRKLEADEKGLLAEKQRNIADQERLRARESVYASDVRAAYAAFQVNDQPEASRILARHRSRSQSQDLRGFEWFYLKSLLEMKPSQVRKKPLTQYIAGVLRSPDGKRIAMATRVDNPGIFLLDAATLEDKRLLPMPKDLGRSGNPTKSRAGNEAQIVSIGWSKDSSRIACGTDSGNLIVWSVGKSDDPRVFNEHDGAVTALAWLPGNTMVAAGSTDGTVRVIHLDGKKTELLVDLRSERKPVEEFPRTAQFIASAQSNVTRPKSEANRAIESQPHRDFESVWLKEQPDSNWILSLDHWPSDDLVALGLRDGTVRIFDISKRAFKQSLRAHRSPVYKVLWSPSGTQLASASFDTRSLDSQVHVTGETIVWNTVDWKPTFTIPGGHPLWLQDGQQIATSAPGEVFVYHRGMKVSGHYADTLANRLSLSSCDRPCVVGCPLAINADSSALVCLSTAEMSTLDLSRQCLHLNAASCTDVSFSPSGNDVAYGTSDGDSIVWDFPSTGQPRRLAAHDDSVTAIAWSQDGSRLATGGRDGVVNVWDAKARAVTNTFRLHKGSVEALIWNPASEWIASSAMDKTIRIWDPDTGEELEKSGPFGEAISALAMPSDGRYLVHASNTSPATIWSPRTGKDTKELATDADISAAPIAVSSDGKYIATMGTGILVWNAEEATLASKIEADGILCMVWSPDGRRIATGDHAGHLKIWNASTGQELLSLAPNIGAIRSIDWHPEGSVLAATGSEPGIRIWDASLGYRLQELGQ